MPPSAPLEGCHPRLPPFSFRKSRDSPANLRSSYLCYLGMWFCFENGRISVCLEMVLYTVGQASRGRTARRPRSAAYVTARLTRWILLFIIRRRVGGGGWRHRDYLHLFENRPRDFRREILAPRRDFPQKIIHFHGGITRRRSVTFIIKYRGSVPALRSDVPALNSDQRPSKTGYTVCYAHRCHGYPPTRSRNRAAALFLLESINNIVTIENVRTIPTRKPRRPGDGKSGRYGGYRYAVIRRSNLNAAAASTPSSKLVSRLLYDIFGDYFLSEEFTDTFFRELKSSVHSTWNKNRVEAIKAIRIYFKCVERIV
ncbi:hypothetical protein GWI33_009142 [Rhynchophorus ferrugineus]|uniref:Uncharacterized protein n=1 Tax=Rhynchophorus ferrugineus TaxID=354439 RepID=A0A834MBS5_RHYFE|nr:hypothetical protein GWI33_009142 [Rhynchophorus ferrugineus]